MGKANRSHLLWEALGEVLSQCALFDMSTAMSSTIPYSHGEMAKPPPPVGEPQKDDNTFLGPSMDVNCVCSKWPS